jgi:ATP-dependent Clp protease ATP-binding subunit ClpA
VLAGFVVSRDELRTATDAGLVFRERVATSVEIPFSTAAKKVLNYAAEEADWLQHSYIGTENLLLGLLREGTSVAASLLNARGVRLDGAQTTVVAILAEPAPPETSVTDMEERIEIIKRHVVLLGHAPAASDEADQLIGTIAAELDALKPLLRGGGNI